MIHGYLTKSGMLESWVLGMPWHPHMLAERLTLSQLFTQPRRHIIRVMPNKLLLAPLNFLTFLRPCKSAGYKKMSARIHLTNVHENSQKQCQIVSTKTHPKRPLQFTQTLSTSVHLQFTPIVYQSSLQTSTKIPLFSPPTKTLFWNTTISEVQTCQAIITYPFLI